MSLYHIKNRAYDRMENVYLYVEKIVNISYQFFFKVKNVKKSLCFLKIRVLSLYVLAFGACANIRLKLNNGQFGTRFVAPKARVAPLKELTIPYLELQGAVLASHLGKSIFRL